MTNREESGPAQRYCSNCGTQVRPSNRFCESCGQSLEPRSGAGPRPRAASYQGPTQYSTVPRNRSAAERAVLTPGQAWFLGVFAVIGTFAALGLLGTAFGPFFPGSQLFYFILVGFVIYAWYKLWRNDKAVKYLTWKYNFEKFLREEKDRLERVNPQNNPNSGVSEEKYLKDLENYENEKRYFEQEVAKFEGLAYYQNPDQRSSEGQTSTDWHQVSRHWQDERDRVLEEFLTWRRSRRQKEQERKQKANESAGTDGS